MIVQIVTAAFTACLPALMVFCFVLWRARFAWDETAGIVGIVALIYAALAWLASFIGLGVLMAVL